VLPVLVLERAPALERQTDRLQRLEPVQQVREPELAPERQRDLRREPVQASVQRLAGPRTDCPLERLLAARRTDRPRVPWLGPALEPAPVRQTDQAPD
jgi:hypothetical protein